MANVAPPTPRRVLGHKNPNAALQTRSPHTKLRTTAPETLSMSPGRQPLKRLLSPDPTTEAGSRAGQKRRMLDDDAAGAEGESADESQSTHDTQDTQPLSQATELLSDACSEQVEEHQDPSTGPLSRSTPSTRFTSFHASQEEPAPPEPQFEIHDEMSQQTLDKMHAVTLSQSTPPLEPPARQPSLAKDTSQLSLSMSSLIDFDEPGSSPPAAATVAANVVSPDQVRKDMMLEKAATLRTRLQLALFKVQTNQVSRPFSRLQLPRVLASRSPSPPAPTHRHSSSRSSSSAAPAPAPAPAPPSPETAVALARIRATAQPKPRVRDLATLPVPRIVPTAFSARWSTGDPQGTCSPRTPVHRSIEVDGEEVDDEEDDNDDDDDAGTEDARPPMRFARRGPPALTSSVVKGEAANGLLELMRGDGGGSLTPSTARRFGPG